MRNTRLLNIHDLGKMGTWPKDVRRIDRRSPYGNPFKIADMLWPAIAFGYSNDAPGRRAASLILYRGWLIGEPITVAGGQAAQAVFGASPRDMQGGGTVEYSNGQSMTVGHVISGLALAPLVEMLKAIELPPHPDLEPLRGFRLACWCAPLACHGEVILEWLGTHPVAS
jgi:hypothetical protein